MGASAGMIAVAAGIVGVFGADGTLGGVLAAAAEPRAGRGGDASSAVGEGEGVASEGARRRAPGSGDGASGAPGSGAEDGPGQGDPGDAAGHRADGLSRHTDPRAVEYFRSRWGATDEAADRIKDIRTVGRYLRIYTDMPETAGNSAHALTLCERGLKYLRAGGVKDPVVFVQAKFGENGNPVLANILGPADSSCRVTHPAPN